MRDIPITPGEMTEFYLPIHEDTPEDERPTYFLGAPNYRQRLRMKKFQKEYGRIQHKIMVAIGASPAKIRRDMEKAGEEVDNEVVRERVLAALKRFNADDDIPDDLEDLEMQLQEITIQPEFIEATLGRNGSPVCLLGWKNVKDVDGEEVEFKRDTYLDDLSDVDIDAMIAVAIHIFETSTISRRAAKNLK